MDSDCAGDLVCLYTHQLASSLDYISVADTRAFTCGECGGMGHGRVCQVSVGGWEGVSSEYGWSMGRVCQVSVGGWEGVSSEWGVGHGKGVSSECGWVGGCVE